MVPVLYFTSIPVLLRKSAPKITSYLQESASNLSAFCWSILQFCQAQVARDYVVLPFLMKCASVHIFLLWENLHSWQYLGRHFLLIMVVVEPESVISHGIGGVHIPAKWRDSLKASCMSKQQQKLVT